MTRPFTIHYSLFTIHYSLFTIHYSLFTIHYSVGLDDLFEAAKVFADLRGGIAPHQLCDRGADSSSRRAVLQPRPHPRAARDLVKVHRSGADHVRSFDRAPADHLVRDLVDDLGVPLDVHAGRALRAPARKRVGDAFDGLEVRHEARQILEVAPEAIQLGDGPVDGHAFVDGHAALAAERAPRVLAGAGGVEAEHLVGAAVALHSAFEEHRAEPR